VFLAESIIYGSYNDFIAPLAPLIFGRAFLVLDWAGVFGFRLGGRFWF